MKSLNLAVKQGWLLKVVIIALAATLCSISACTHKVTTTTVPPAPSLGEATGRDANAPFQWSDVTTPFPTANITSQGNLLWICGANEMIASSSDGGKNWNLRHSRSGGKTLLNIAFVNASVGQAAGKGGILLWTMDGGKTWKPSEVGDDVIAFSFADAKNGIAIVGGDPSIVSYVPTWGDVTSSDGVVKLTHDGGTHWEEIAALKSEDLKPFSQVLAVAALDSDHYAMLRRHPGIEDIFLFSVDAGRSWKIARPRNDDTNREMPRWLFAQNGDYWAFGMQLLNRQRGGGYGAPLAMHSKDGETWKQGVNGGKQFGGCNSQGCYMWDGAVERLYGPHEQYWNVPQDQSLSNKWAITANTICTVGSVVECGPAVSVSESHPMVKPARAQQFHLIQRTTNLPFDPDCVKCEVRPIWPDPQMNWRSLVTADFSVDATGAIYGLSLEGIGDHRVTDQLDEQIRAWTFKISPDTAPRKKRVSMNMNCLNVADAPAIGGCRMTPTGSPGN